MRLNEDLPTPSNSNPGPYYVNTGTDRNAGCEWGMLVCKRGSNLHVLTPAGMRYYGVTSECRIIGPGDVDYERVRKTWQAVLDILTVALPKL